MVLTVGKIEAENDGKAIEMIVKALGTNTQAEYEILEKEGKYYSVKITFQDYETMYWYQS